MEFSNRVLLWNSHMEFIHRALMEFHWISLMEFSFRIHT